MPACVLMETQLQIKGVPAWCADKTSSGPPCNATCKGAKAMPACCPGNEQGQTCGGFGIMEAFDIRDIKCSNASHRINADYCDPSQPVGHRVADLTKRATTAEKISMLGRHTTS